jgi:hypothetical protein
LAHDGQVIAPIDVLGRIAPDISRTRITNTADNAVVWDVKPLSNQSECWNNCWKVCDGKGRVKIRALSVIDRVPCRSEGRHTDMP